MVQGSGHPGTGRGGGVIFSEEGGSLSPGRILCRTAAWLSSLAIA